ncbi:MAG: hypothetical protein LBQ14_07845 [Treponema sp.]|jgi:hypothetical protein|nr:hypothetical protein [Treponema sp.]
MKCSKTTQVDTNVKMVNCLEAETYAGKIWTTASEPWQLGSKEWVVMLEGYKSCFAVNCLETVK